MGGRGKRGAAILCTLERPRYLNVVYVCNIYVCAICTLKKRQQGSGRFCGRFRKWQVTTKKTLPGGNSNEGGFTFLGEQQFPNNSSEN